MTNILTIIASARTSVKKGRVITRCPELDRKGLDFQNGSSLLQKIHPRLRSVPFDFLANKFDQYRPSTRGETATINRQLRKN